MAEAWRGRFPFLLAAGAVIVAAALYPLIGPAEPLPIDYGMSWAVLSLISMLTLSYVDLLNRLDDKRHMPEGERPPVEKIDTASQGLAWTALIMFLAVLALVVRILVLSWHPQTKHQVLCAADYVLLLSFAVSSVMRFVLFLRSYGRNLRRPAS